jgi:hypothetical protein
MVEKDRKKVDLASNNEDTTYPSTCLLANVVAFCSLVCEGQASRFVRLGTLPAVCLSCVCHFDRDDVTGELFSVEFATHQEDCITDMRRWNNVCQVLPPATGADWATYFAGTRTQRVKQSGKI